MFKVGEKVLYRPNAGELLVCSYRAATDEYTLAPSLDSEVAVVAKASEVAALVEGLSDLDLLKMWVDLLRKHEGRLHFGNAMLYTKLAKYHKSKAAFEIAFHAVYGVSVPAQMTQLFFDVLEGVAYSSALTDKATDAD